MLFVVPLTLGSAGSMSEAQGGRHTIAMDKGLCPFGADAFRLALLYIYTGELPATDVPLGVETGASSRNMSTSNVGARAPSPLEPTTEGVARLLELLMAAGEIACVNAAWSTCMFKALGACKRGAA